MSQTVNVVYQYGVPSRFDKLETEWKGRSLMIDQMRLALEYRNRLADLERSRREEVDQLSKSVFPDMWSIKQAIDNQCNTIEMVRAEISNRNKENKRRTSTVEDEERMDLLYCHLRHLYAKRQKCEDNIKSKEVRSLLKQRRELLAHHKCYSKLPFGEGPPDVLALEADIDKENRKFLSTRPGLAQFRQDLEDINTRYRKVQKHYQHTNGLHWGTYLVVDGDADRFRKGDPPAPNKNWSGEGRIAVQFQGGMNVEDFVAPWPDNKNDADLVALREEKIWVEGKKALLVLRQSIPTGSYYESGSPKREYDWISIPFNYHRKLPKDAVIQWIFITRRRIGPQYIWSVNLSIKTTKVVPSTKPKSQVAINYNWELFPNGDLQVATWLASDGQRGRIVLDFHYFLKRHKNIDDTQTLRSDGLSNMKGRLLVLLEKIKKLPEWLQQDLDGDNPDDLNDPKALRNCYFPGRFYSIRRYWREHRFKGDEEAFTTLDFWCKHDRPLWIRLVRLKKKVRLYRKHCYRVFAAKMTGHSVNGKGYAKVVVPGVSFEIRKPSPEERKSQPTLRKYKVMLAFAELTQCIKQKALTFVQDKKKKEYNKKTKARTVA